MANPERHHIRSIEEECREQADILRAIVRVRDWGHDTDHAARADYEAIAACAASYLRERSVT